MSRLIKACEVLPGDTVQWTFTELGIEVSERFTVSKVSGLAGTVYLHTVVGGFRKLFGGTELTLLSRPSPQLPTEPGSVIVAYEVRGVRNEDGWRLMRTATDPNTDSLTWVSMSLIADFHWHSGGHITDWLPATVTTKETE